MLVDTHCHVFSEYYEDLDSVIDRAKPKGIKMLIVNGYNAKSNREVLELVKKYDIVYGALGIQPEEIEDYTESNLAFIREHINDNKIIAVGEIGLDYHYDCDRNKQKELFRKQLDIASEFNKAIIVHSRDCIQETYNILKEYTLKGIMHCYSGSVEMALQFIEIGFLLGIGGICTFNNASRIIDVIKRVDIAYIVLETDCPYLSPVPFRGTRNEPANISVILQKICELKSLKYKEVEEATTLNVLRLFDKDIKL